MKERIQFFRDSLTGSPVFKHFVLVGEKKFGRKVDDTPRIKRKERKKKKKQNQRRNIVRSKRNKGVAKVHATQSLVAACVCVCVCLCVYARVRCTKKCNIYKYTRNIDKMKNLHGLVGCFNF